jgi:glucosamine-6-phosphate deaminase
MKVILCETTQDAARCAADIVIARVVARPDAVIGLATGATMTPLYQRLVAACRARCVSFARTRVFNLDDYIGLAPDHPCSFTAYLYTAFLDHIDIQPHNIHLIRGDMADPMAGCRGYETLIASCGGIDLQLLGLGQNGHIGFNEPGSDFGSRTRVQALSAQTRQANAIHFTGHGTVPGLAVTMGIASILDARECLLVATGAAKARAAAAMIAGGMDPEHPASALQSHPNTTVVLDRAAARDLGAAPDFPGILFEMVNSRTQGHEDPDPSGSTM